MAKRTFLIPLALGVAALAAPAAASIPEMASTELRAESASTPVADLVLHRAQGGDIRMADHASHSSHESHASHSSHSSHSSSSF
jgi:hypothetical protein